MSTCTCATERVPAFGRFSPGPVFFFVGLLQFGPLAVEPPEDILGPYSSPVAGYAALGWLVAFLLLLAVIAVYAACRWWPAAKGNAR